MSAHSSRTDPSALLYTLSDRTEHTTNEPGHDKHQSSSLLAAERLNRFAASLEHDAEWTSQFLPGRK